MCKLVKNDQCHIDLRLIQSNSSIPKNIEYLEFQPIIPRAYCTDAEMHGASRPGQIVMSSPNEHVPARGQSFLCAELESKAVNYARVILLIGEYPWRSWPSAYQQECPCR